MKLLLFQRYMTNFPMLSSQTSIMAPPPSFWGMMLPSFYCHFALKQLNWLKQLCENCFPWFRALVSSTYLLFSGQPRSAIAHTMGWTNFWRIILISNQSSFFMRYNLSNLYTFIVKRFIEHGQSRITKVILKILISLDRN